MEIILCAVLTACVVIALIKPLGRTNAARGIVVLVPLAALGLYLLLGAPDMPSAPRAAAKGIEQEHAALLAARPMQVLQENPQDAGALAALGEINLRLNRKDDAQAFYKRAAASAKKNNDPRADIYAKKAKE